MDAGDAGRKGAHLIWTKPALANISARTSGVGKVRIDLGEVAVAVSIPGDKSSHQREGIEGPDVIDALQGATPDL